MAVADRGQEEAEQGRGVGGIDAGHGGRLTATHSKQVCLGQPVTGSQRIVGDWGASGLIVGCALHDGINT